MSINKLMDLSTPDIDVIWIQRMLAGIQRLGEPYTPFLKEAKIPSQLLSKSSAYVNTRQLTELFQVLIDRRQDEALGFLTRPFKYGSYAMITNYALGAHTLGQAIQRTVRAIELLQDDFILNLRRHDDRVVISLSFKNIEVSSYHFLHIMIMIVYSRFFSWLIGGDLPILQFDFSYKIENHERDDLKFFMAPRNYDCDQTGFWFSTNYLRMPIKRDKVALRKYLARSTTNIIFPEQFDRTISTRVRHELNSYSPWLNLISTAKKLHMSTATLQRKLASEGTSFQKIKDELRCEIAMTRLSTSKAPLAILSQELGYADCPTFERAFKMWTGMAPGAYRKSKSHSEY